MEGQRPPWPAPPTPTSAEHGAEGEGRLLRVAVAAAPCSFGAFEVTVGIDASVPDATVVLDVVRQAGYAGIDLGPAGYLGLATEIGERLTRHALVLSGGWIALPFAEPERLSEAMAGLHSVLDLFDAASADGAAPHPPRPTLADTGSEARRAAPGQAQHEPGLGLPRESWNAFAEAVCQAAEVCRRRGYEPTFHHHAATYVEAPWEIERLLDKTDVGLCLDTGHLLLGGGDPVQAVRDWGARINHVHLKDVRMETVEALLEERAPMVEVWRRRAFCALGDGDLDVDGVLDALTAAGYRGWLVVEQDTLPGAPDQAALDQRRNREYLRIRGL